MTSKEPWYFELYRYYRKERIEKAVEKLRSEQSVLYGLAGGLGAAVVGLAVWKVLYCLGGLIPALFPLLLGSGIAFGVRFFGKGDHWQFSLLGLVCYFGAVFFLIGVWGIDCSLTFSGINLLRFRTLDEVGFLSVIGGGVLAWYLSRRRIDGDLVLSELKKMDT